jgi:hypothetical protein
MKVHGASFDLSPVYPVFPVDILPLLQPLPSCSIAYVKAMRSLHAI